MLRAGDLEKGSGEIFGLYTRMRERFRFENLRIWQLAIELTDELFDIADQLESRRLYRFSEQLRGAGLSITNNIAEGSGSSSSRDFANFLNYSRRSLYEVVNIVIVLHRRKIVDETEKEQLLSKLDTLSRQITNFRKSLLR